MRMAIAENETQRAAVTSSAVFFSFGSFSKRGYSGGRMRQKREKRGKRLALVASLSLLYEPDASLVVSFLEGKTTLLTDPAVSQQPAGPSNRTCMFLLFVLFVC